MKRLIIIIGASMGGRVSEHLSRSKRIIDSAANQIQKQKTMSSGSPKPSQDRRFPPAPPALPSRNNRAEKVNDNNNNDNNSFVTARARNSSPQRTVKSDVESGSSPQRTTALIGALQKKFSSSRINLTSSLPSAATSPSKASVEKSDATSSPTKSVPSIEGMQKITASRIEAQKEKLNTSNNNAKSPKSRTASALPLVSNETKKKVKGENTETTGSATVSNPNNKKETATGTAQEDDNSKARAIRKRRELIKELIKTEENYVCIMTFFWEVNAEKAKQLSRLPERDWLTLFGNVEQILGANRTLLEALKTEAERVGQGNEDQCCIGKIFVDIAPYFKLYTDFM